LPYKTLRDWFLQPKWRVFTARYALSPYIKQIRFVFKGLILVFQDSYHLFPFALLFSSFLHLMLIRSPFLWSSTFLILVFLCCLLRLPHCPYVAFVQQLRRPDYWSRYVVLSAWKTATSAGQIVTEFQISNI
jgi:hypothetical protein